MFNLNTLFTNFFERSAISDNNIRKFAEVNLERLSANNGNGEFSQIIADTQNAYNQYFGSMSEEDKNFAMQQGLTISVYKLLKEI